MTDITPEAIFQLASGFMAAKHLFVANEIGLFDKLAPGPATLDTLAELTGIARPRVRILAGEVPVSGEFAATQGSEAGGTGSGS